MNVEHDYEKTISVKIRGENGVADFYFPISDGVMRDRLIEMDMDDPDDLVLLIESVAEPKVLKTLEGKKIDLDELNYLAKTLTSFDKQEMRQFCAAVEYKQTADMKELINITFNLHRYTLLPEGTDIEKAGRIHTLTRMQCVSVSEFEKMEFKKIGIELLSSGKGIATESGTLFINDDLEEYETYDGKLFPAFCFHESPVMAAIEYGGKTEFVYLPEDDLAIDKAVHRLGADCLASCSVTLDPVECSEKLFEDYKKALEERGLYKVNELAEDWRYVDQIEDMEAKEKMKVVMVEPNKPAYVTEIGKDLASLKKAVGGGLIEVIPYLEDADMVGNEEAKLIGMEGNRRFPYGIVAGPFFICGTEMTDDGEDFCSLSDELCEKYVKRFAEPEKIPQEEVERDIGYRLIFF